MPKTTVPRPAELCQKPCQIHMLRCSDVIGLHKAIGYAPAAAIGAKIRSDTIMPIGAGIVPVLK